MASDKRAWELAERIRLLESRRAELRTRAGRASTTDQAKTAAVALAVSRRRAAEARERLRRRFGDAATAHERAADAHVRAAAPGGRGAAEHLAAARRHRADAREDRARAAEL